MGNISLYQKIKVHLFHWSWDGTVPPSAPPIRPLCSPKMILWMAPLLQTRLVSGFVLWLVCYPPGTSWPASLSGFSTLLSTSATRPGPSTHRSLTSVTNSSDTSRFLPTQHSPSSHRKSDWLRLAPATNTSRNWPLWVERKKFKIQKRNAC